ncbi:hypothetical protein [Pantoea sp. GM01]|uniref:hypothetical protein n=1 Tax=Pantoea sp. GM01 TaxID=1144320 RepID=UPI00027134B8|nr:hypothetical protein [Pantoea sp. GM01]EJL82849.1 hypothetical protein PMI17_04391 [Pantoea sp. GM01]
MMTEEQKRFEAWASVEFDTRLLKHENGNYRGQVLQQMWQAWQAALTQPASTTFKLPDVILKDGDLVISGHGGGWNECLAEIQLLNAPHTAQIEPICATGGAEWVKEAEHLAEIYGTSFVMFRHGEKPQCADPTKVIISFTDEGLGYEPATPED